MDKQIKLLEVDEQYYQEHLDTESEKLNQLNSNPAEIERIAREKHFLKKMMKIFLSFSKKKLRSHKIKKMSKLFENFDSISEKEWKNKVQVELKGLEYNETLVWGTNDQINVKPLYTKDDVDYSAVQPLPKSSKDWKIISKYTGNKTKITAFVWIFD